LHTWLLQLSQPVGILPSMLKQEHMVCPTLCFKIDIVIKNTIDLPAVFVTSIVAELVDHIEQDNERGGKGN
jgi:hypothetical protein